MQNKIINDPGCTCMLVEVIAKKSQNIAWKTSLDGESVYHEKIRRASIDKFYEIVTGNNIAFKQLCEILPKVITDVVETTKLSGIESTVLGELQAISNNLLKSIYLFSFQRYEGFESFNVDQ